MSWETVIGWLVIIAFVAGGMYWAWRNGLGGGQW